MEADSMTADIKLDEKVEFSPRLTSAVSDLKYGKEALRKALCLISQTFYLASCKRRGPKENVTHFSVNIGEKGRVELIRLKAMTEFGMERKVIAIDLPESEWGSH